jgi:hypothetical protein
MKWDKSIHAVLSAETVPDSETRANTGFAIECAKYVKIYRTKSMHENGATHLSGATLLFATLLVYPNIYSGTNCHAQYKIL